MRKNLEDDFVISQPLSLNRCVETVGPKPLRRFITPFQGVFDQTFFEKACVAPFDHAVVRGFRSSLFLKGLRSNLF
jgi:hypothetical protein